MKISLGPRATYERFSLLMLLDGYVSPGRQTSPVNGIYELSRDKATVLRKRPGSRLRKTRTFKMPGSPTNICIVKISRLLLPRTRSHDDRYVKSHHDLEVLMKPCRSKFPYLRKYIHGVQKLLFAPRRTLTTDIL